MRRSKLSIFVFFILVCILSSCKSNNSNYTFEILVATNDEVPKGYYDSLEDVNLTNLMELKSKLSNIINTDAKKLSYSAIWNVIEDADKSDNQGYINCFYTVTELKIGTSGQRSYNREHTWPKSHGFPNESDTPFTDAYHLRATLVSINSSRGNSDFGEVDHSVASKDEFGNYWTGSVFEPRDEVKGDIARILFYMETRYYKTSPYNLELINADLSSPSDNFGKLCNLKTLIKWNYLDPVSSDEINRSNIIYNYQNNRNPFVDHPEFVGMIYHNEYTNNIIDNGKINDTITAIDSLDTSVLDTLAIDNAYNLYKALNYSERLYVSNYSKLSKLVKISIPNDDAINSNIIDFQDDTTVIGSYGKDRIATVLDKTYNISYGGKFNGVVRLGFKNATEVVASKYGLGDNISGAALEFNYTINNLKSIKFNFISTYSGLDKIFILAKEEANSYTIIKESSTITSSIEGVLDTKKNASIVLIITGNTPRVDLGKVTYINE